MHQHGTDLVTTGRKKENSFSIIKYIKEQQGLHRVNTVGRAILLEICLVNDPLDRPKRLEGHGLSMGNSMEC